MIENDLIYKQTSGNIDKIRAASLKGKQTPFGVF